MIASKAEYKQISILKDKNVPLSIHVFELRTPRGKAFSLLSVQTFEFKGVRIHRQAFPAFFAKGNFLFLCLDDLSHSYQETRKKVIGKQCDQDRTPHDVASDQGLHCLISGFSKKNELKRQNRPDIPKITNELIQHIRVKESTSIG